MRDPDQTLNFGVFDHLDFGNATLGEAYELRLRVAEALDRLGYYSYHLAEHHFTPLGGSPSPSVFLAALSQRTKRLRFGPLVYLLPFYHPIRLAEEICMLDNLSNGRLDVGIGRGISPIESGLFGNVPDQAQAVFNETRDVMLQALTSASVTHKGPRYTFAALPTQLHPVQTPHPPLWYGTNTAKSAEACAQAGYNLIIPNVGDEAREVISRYFAECRRCDARNLKAGLSRFIIVADTDTEALEVARGAYPVWYRSFIDLYRRNGRGPILGERPAEFDPIAESGKGIAGSPKTVAAILREQIEESGANYVMGQFVFGDMSLSSALRSVELFGTHVMPELRKSFVESLAMR